LISVGSSDNIFFTARRLKWPAITNRFTRARSICGSCSGKSGTLSGDCGEAEALGTGAVVPAWAWTQLAQITAHAMARPPLIRKLSAKPVCCS
jgi:hypothetical protein